jgi:hypothetical protein
MTMWKRLLCTLVLVPLLCGIGCDSTDADACLDLAWCTGVAIEDGSDLVDLIVEVLINGSFNPSTGAYSTTVGGVTISGVVSEVTGDGDDNFEVEETWQGTYTLTGGSSGSGTLRFYYSSVTAVQVTETTNPTISGTSGCTLTLTDMDIAVDPTGAGYPNGIIDFEASAGGDCMCGSIFFYGTETAEVAVECDVPIVGNVDCSFSLDLDSFEIFDFSCGT